MSDGQNQKTAKRKSVLTITRPVSKSCCKLIKTIAKLEKPNTHWMKEIRFINITVEFFAIRK